MASLIEAKVPIVSYSVLNSSQCAKSAMELILLFLPSSRSCEQNRDRERLSRALQATEGALAAAPSPPPQRSCFSQRGVEPVPATQPLVFRSPNRMQAVWARSNIDRCIAPAATPRFVTTSHDSHLGGHRFCFCRR